MTYRIRTPENVTFEFPLAGLTSRGLAWAIDVVMMLALIVLAAQLITPLAEWLGGFALALLFFLIFVVQWGYSTLLEWFWGGRTIGKRVLSIRAVSDDGTRITFIQAVIRNLVRVVDLLPGIYLIGGVSALADKHRRRLGDFAAGTIVIQERKAPAPSTIVPDTERTNSFVDDPSVAHAVRRITAPERDAMIALCLRRERLALPVRRDLFVKLATHLEARLGVQRPAFFSEEKYVLNLTAVALGARRARD